MEVKHRPSGLKNTSVIPRVIGTVDFCQKVVRKCFIFYTFEIFNKNGLREVVLSRMEQSDLPRTFQTTFFSNFLTIFFAKTLNISF